ncbi:MAG: leucine-rich repeat protein, partial [Oscillospiraceae bacterium]|nr:leucine-rich repeat protein [Oscillospiraceae bacterium]
MLYIFTAAIGSPGRAEKTFTIPDTVTTIGDNAFYGCNKIMGIAIPDSVTSIG